MDNDPLDGVICPVCGTKLVYLDRHDRFEHPEFDERSRTMPADIVRRYIYEIRVEKVLCSEGHLVTKEYHRKIDDRDKGWPDGVITEIREEWQEE